MFSFVKTCPKCKGKFNIKDTMSIKDVTSIRITKCPYCKTPLISTLSSTFVSGIFLVIGFGISEVLSSKGIPFYIPFIIIVLIALFIIEPLSTTYKIKE